MQAAALHELRGRMRVVAWLVAALSRSGARKQHYRLISVGACRSLLSQLPVCIVANTEFSHTQGINPACEMVRWALDVGGLVYTEDMHPPGSKIKSGFVLLLSYFAPLLLFIFFSFSFKGI